MVGAFTEALRNLERQRLERQQLDQMREYVRRLCELDYRQVCDLTAEDCRWIFKQFLMDD